MNTKQLAMTCMLAALGVLGWRGLPAQAQTSDATGFLNGQDFSHRNGPQIYATVCQSCHMEAGQGAKGAGEYPALASNPKLAAAPYVEMMVLGGHGAMPGFGRMLDDKQVVAITTYVRTHFGNRYDDPVTVDDVKALRTSLAIAATDDE